MIIMGGVIDATNQTAAAANEAAKSSDTNDGAQDFAALLAAWFAPAATPVTPEPTPNTEASGGQTLAVTADQPAALPLTFQAEVTGETPALPTSIFSETMPTESAPVDLQQKMAAATAGSTTALPLPSGISTPNSAPGTAPGSFEMAGYTDSSGLASQEDTPASSFDTGAVKLAAQVVKDILGETKPITPPLQKLGTGDFSGAESHSAATANEPTNPAATAVSAFRVEADMPPPETAHAAVTTAPVQAQSTANSTAPGSTNNDNSPHPIARQTMEPLVELAQQTARGETRSLRFHLHPEELGRVEIEVTRDAGGRVSASLNAERIDAANSLTQSLGHLREALEKAGVKVDHLNVFATPQHQNNGQGQTAQQQPSHTPRATPGEQLLTDQASEESAATIEEEKLLNLRA